MIGLNLSPFWSPPLLDEEPGRKTFSIGDILRVRVPEEKKAAYKFFVDATVQVASKKKFLENHPSAMNNKSIIGPEKIIVKLLKGPTLPRKMLGRQYPLRRAWLEDIGEHYCDCDLRTVLMVKGCQCGGM